MGRLKWSKFIRSNFFVANPIGASSTRLERSKAELVGLDPQPGFDDGSAKPDHHRIKERIRQGSGQVADGSARWKRSHR